jgi:hypothetical protein
MSRIAIVIFFTLAFAACAVFLADGRRLAMFGACAAYAAVLVVFVSGDWTTMELSKRLDGQLIFMAAERSARYRAGEL